MFQIYDFLKATILKSYKDVEKQEQSGWVKEVVNDKANIDDFVLETVQNRYSHIVQKAFMVVHSVDLDIAFYLDLHQG